jgi:death-on-curing protein
LFSKSVVLKLHKKIIRKTGGTFGIRDENLLMSSLNQPFQTFAGVELYPSVEEKAGKLLETIIKNHPFVDGNKRTAYVLFKLYLYRNNLKIIASEDEKYNFVMAIAEGKYNFEKIVEWIRKNTKKF